MNPFRKIARKSDLLTRLYRASKAVRHRWKYGSLPDHVQVGPHRLKIGSDLGMRINYHSKAYFDCLEDVLRDHVSPGDTILDIGAHVGVTATHFSSCVGPEGKVFAIEPTPNSFKLIQENIAANNIINITPVQAALSGSNGHQQLFTSTLHTGFNSLSRSNTELCYGSAQCSSTEVETLTLDTLIDRHNIEPRLIKIDCQGAEYEILSGATRFCAAQHPRDIFFHIELWPTAIENYSDISAEKFFELADALGLEIVGSEDYPDEIRAGKVAAFVAKVADLPRGYTNILARLPAS